MEKREPTWANEVVRLREAFYQNKADRQQMMKEESPAVINIAQLFGPRWRLPAYVIYERLVCSRGSQCSRLGAFESEGVVVRVCPHA